MTRAIAPKERPPLPEGMQEWARSSRRGAMFHAHALGITACRRLVLDRHKSEPAKDLGDMQYWGVCPRCFAKAGDQS